jgi:hypothetical protein
MASALRAPGVIFVSFRPWIYQKPERDRVGSGQAAMRARQIELALIDVLAESDDIKGIIGIEARKSLKLSPEQCLLARVRSDAPFTI